MRGTGVVVSIDDCGTHHSSISTLRRLPVDMIKIDRSLIDGLRSAFQERDLVAAMVDLAHALGMKAPRTSGVSARGRMRRDPGLAHRPRGLRGPPANAKVAPSSMAAEKLHHRSRLVRVRFAARGDQPRERRLRERSVKQKTLNAVAAEFLQAPQLQVGLDPFRHPHRGSAAGAPATPREQDQGLGSGMLQDAVRRTLMIAEQAGIRALPTHPIDAEAEAFYRRFGFESTPVHERQLILLLKDARHFA